LEQKVVGFAFYFRKKNRFFSGKIKKVRIIETEFLGLSIEAALDLRFSGIDARI